MSVVSISYFYFPQWFYYFIIIDLACIFKPLGNITQCRIMKRIQSASNWSVERTNQIWEKHTIIHDDTIVMDIRSIN